MAAQLDADLAATHAAVPPLTSNSEKLSIPVPPGIVIRGWLDCGDRLSIPSLCLALNQTMRRIEYFSLLGMPVYCP